MATIQKHEVSFRLTLEVVINRIFILRNLLVLNGNQGFKLFFLELHELQNLIIFLRHLANYRSILLELK